MLNNKILDVMNEVCTEVAEREELIECIAIALLTKKNLFILGDTGQAKSHCINEFRKRITGSKQFERLLSKQVDEEMLFGRLDLASLIPGNIPNDQLVKDISYGAYYNQLKKLNEEYAISGNEDTRRKMTEITKSMDELKKVLYKLNGNNPKMVITGKIPDSHIVFLDEIFKANDGILNSLLTALNERVYTNEGQVVHIPVISFFSASNEIPNFNDETEKILKPLYDRFDLKVVTRYVEDRQNRLDVLHKKQHKVTNKTVTTLSLDELIQIQSEVALIKVSDSINELMDDILCELRKSGIHVSDRKFFNYFPLVQAKAYLRGGSEVSSSDLIILKNYLWTLPEEIAVINQLLQNMCQNPIHSKVQALIYMADEAFDDYKENKEHNKSFVKFRKEILKVFSSVCDLELKTVTDNDNQEIAKTKEHLENVSKEAHKIKGFTYVPLAEMKEYE